MEISPKTYLTTTKLEKDLFEIFLYSKKNDASLKIHFTEAGLTFLLGESEKEIFVPWNEATLIAESVRGFQRAHQEQSK